VKYDLLSSIYQYARHSEKKKLTDADFL